MRTTTRARTAGPAGARPYAQVAPSAHHALHMPSHIFVQLGLWETRRLQRGLLGRLQGLGKAKAAAERRVGSAHGRLAALRLSPAGPLRVGRGALTDSLGALFPVEGRAEAPHHVHAYLIMVDCQNVGGDAASGFHTADRGVQALEAVLQAAAGAMPRGDRETVAAGLAGFRRPGGHHQATP